MTTTIIWTIAVITGLGLLLALALYLVAQRFKVEEDPRIEEVEKAMPGANGEVVVSPAATRSPRQR